MEGLGEKFQKARQARNLTLEEAARMTKIRPAKLAELEAEDFSHFPSLAYAKGFLLIYGKFLNVDVTPYLEAFEAPETMTVDGYSYLQDNPVPAPRRTEVIRTAPRSRGSLMPFVIGVVVLVVGFTVLKFMLNLGRIKPSERDAQALAAAGITATPLPTGAQTMVAPKALPLGTPLPQPTAVAVSTPPPPSATPLPTAMALATPPEAEPEVRRAEPVHPEDLAKAQAVLAANTPAPTPEVKVFDVRPLRKTFVRVTLDSEKGRTSFERWIDPSAPLELRGKRLVIKVLDPADVELLKNGKPVGLGDTDVRVE